MLVPIVGQYTAFSQMHSNEDVRYYHAILFYFVHVQSNPHSSCFVLSTLCPIELPPSGLSRHFAEGQVRVYLGFSMFLFRPNSMQPARLGQSGNRGRRWFQRKRSPACKTKQGLPQDDGDPASNLNPGDWYARCWDLSDRSRQCSWNDRQIFSSDPSLIRLALSELELVHQWVVQEDDPAEHLLLEIARKRSSGSEQIAFYPKVSMVFQMANIRVHYPWRADTEPSEALPNDCSLRRQEDETWKPKARTVSKRWTSST